MRTLASKELITGIAFLSRVLTGFLTNGFVNQASQTTGSEDCNPFSSIGQAPNKAFKLRISTAVALALTTSLTVIDLLDLTVLADDALPPGFGETGPMAKVSVVGAAPIIRVEDRVNDDDFDYDIVHTNDMSFTASVEARCEEGKWASTKGSVWVKNYNQDEWLDSYFTFQAEPWHWMPGLQLILPKHGVFITSPSLPDAVNVHALNLCNGLSQVEKPLGKVFTSVIIGDLRYATSCEDEPGATDGPFESLWDTIIDGWDGGYTFDTYTNNLLANTPLLANIHCEPVDMTNPLTDSTPSGPDDLQTAEQFQLVDADLTLSWENPAQAAAGNCPAVLEVDAVVRANLTGPFKTWVDVTGVDGFKFNSNPVTLNTDTPIQGGLVKKDFSDTLVMPLQGLNASGGGGTGGAKAYGGDISKLQVGSGDDGGFNPSQDYQAENNQSGDNYKVWVRVHATTLDGPGGKAGPIGGLVDAVQQNQYHVVSGWKTASIACKPVVAIGPASGGGAIQMNPKPEEPPVFGGKARRFDTPQKMKPVDGQPPQPPKPTNVDEFSPPQLGVARLNPARKKAATKTATPDPEPEGKVKVVSPVAKMKPKEKAPPDVVILRVTRVNKRAANVVLQNRGEEDAQGCAVELRTGRVMQKSSANVAGSIGGGSTTSVQLPTKRDLKLLKRARVVASCRNEPSAASNNNEYRL